MSTKTRRHKLLFLKFACTIVLLIILIERNLLDVNILFAVQFSISTILLLLFLLFVFSFLQIFRWFCLIKSQNISITFTRCTSLYFISQFFTSFLPGVVGGDIIRSMYLAGDKSATNRSVISTVITDRLLGIHSLVLIAAFSYVATAYNLPEIYNSSAVILGHYLIAAAVLGTLGAVIVAYFLRSYSSRGIIEKTTNPPKLNTIISLYFSHPLLLSTAVLGSLVSSIVFIASFWVVGSQFDTSLSFSQSAMAVPLIALSNMVPLTPGGIGVGETTSDFVLRVFQISTGAETMLTLRLWILLTRLPGGLLFIITKRKV